MKTNIVLGSADIAVLIVLLILFIAALRIAWGFFHEKQDDDK